jgi:hypothetical protein
MSVVTRIANGAFEGFLAGGALGAVAENTPHLGYSWGRPIGFAAQLGAGVGGFVKGGAAGAIVGGILGSLGNDRPVSGALDSVLGRDGVDAPGGAGLSDALASLAARILRA